MGGMDATVRVCGRNSRWYVDVVVAQGSVHAPVLGRNSLLAWMDESAVLWVHDASRNTVIIYVDVDMALKYDVLEAIAEEDCEMPVRRVYLEPSGIGVCHGPAGRVTAKNGVVVPPADNDDGQSSLDGFASRDVAAGVELWFFQSRMAEPVDIRVRERS